MIGIAEGLGASLVVLEAAILLVIAVVACLRWVTARGPGFGEVILGGLALAVVVSMVALLTQPWGATGICGASALNMLFTDVNYAPPGPPAGCGTDDARRQVGMAVAIVVWTVVAAVIATIVRDVVRPAVARRAAARG